MTPSLEEAFRKGLQSALDKGFLILKNGGAIWQVAPPFFTAVFTEHHYNFPGHGYEDCRQTDEPNHAHHHRAFHHYSC